MFPEVKPRFKVNKINCFPRDQSNLSDLFKLEIH